MRPFRILLFSLALAGCASIPYEKLAARLGRRDFEGLARLVGESEKDYGKQSRLLYHFDHAMALHLKGDWSASNQDVAAAGELIDELYTKSLSGEALAFLSNDMALPYAGENFQRVGIHVLGLLNYALLGLKDEALVEAKKAEQRLKQTQDAVGGGKVAYSEDALARYLSALLYEEAGGQERWDAYLDYKHSLRALEAYHRDYGQPLPRRIGVDLQRLAKGLGEAGEAKEWEQRFGPFEGATLKETASSRCEVVVLLFEGLAPAKVSEGVQLPIVLKDGTRQFFTAAFPAYRRRDEEPASAWVLVGEQREELEVFQDWAAIAVRDLKDRVGLLTLKAIARATAKFQAARAIQQEARKAGQGAELLAFLGTNLYSLASEQADTRSWRTLPARVQLARLDLPPGRHRVSLELRQGGAQEMADLGELDLKAGDKALLRYAAY